MKYKLENPDYQLPLVELASKREWQSILEVGYGHGFSSYVWLNKTNAKVTSVDKGDWHHKHDDSRLKFILGSSHDVLPKLKGRYDLIYIDGSHLYEDVYKDIVDSMKLITPDGVILLDDYGVKEGDGVDFHEDGQVINGKYGVKKAADKLFKDWHRVYADIGFANGGRAYAQTKLG